MSDDRELDIEKQEQNDSQAPGPARLPHGAALSVLFFVDDDAEPGGSG
jgi:hypothetical protein